METKEISQQLQVFGYNKNEIEIAINNVHNANDINSIIQYMEKIKQQYQYIGIIYVYFVCTIYNYFVFVVYIYRLCQ